MEEEPTRPKESNAFRGAVAIFFGLVAFAVVIATLVNAPLSFDGAYFFFRALDEHQFAAFHGRLINIPLQMPLLAAAHFTQDIRILRLAFCGAYASIPLLGLALSWLICRVRRPSLLVWPAMSICIAALPGQFSLQSESIMTATLLWPALLAVLLGARTRILALVANSSVAAAASHPEAPIVFAFIVVVAIASGIARPELRRASIGFAIVLGLLLLARALTPLDPYEVNALAFGLILATFKESVIGGPLLALALVAIAALSCVFAPRAHARAFLMASLGLAGVVLVVWAVQPLNWARCAEYRGWVVPFSLPFMAGAAVETLWRQRSPEPQLQDQRLYALPLIGGIFCAVLSIQSLQWERASQLLADELVSSDRGCVSHVTSVQQYRAGLLGYRFLCR